jgi:hypothetical protein
VYVLPDGSTTTNESVYNNAVAWQKTQEIKPATVIPASIPQANANASVESSQSVTVSMQTSPNQDQARLQPTKEKIINAPAAQPKLNLVANAGLLTPVAKPTIISRGIFNVNLDNGVVPMSGALASKFVSDTKTSPLYTTQEGIVTTDWMEATRPTIHLMNTVSPADKTIFAIEKSTNTMGMMSTAKESSSGILAQVNENIVNLPGYKSTQAQAVNLIENFPNPVLQETGLGSFDKSLRETFIGGYLGLSNKPATTILETGVSFGIGAGVGAGMEALAATGTIGGTAAMGLGVAGLGLYAGGTAFNLISAPSAGARGEILAKNFLNLGAFSLGTDVGTTAVKGSDWFSSLTKTSNIKATTINKGLENDLNFVSSPSKAGTFEVNWPYGKSGKFEMDFSGVGQTGLTKQDVDLFGNVKMKGELFQKQDIFSSTFNKIRGKSTAPKSLATVSYEGPLVEWLSLKGGKAEGPFSLLLKGKNQDINILGYQESTIANMKGASYDYYSKSISTTNYGKDLIGSESLGRVTGKTSVQKYTPVFNELAVDINLEGGIKYTNAPRAGATQVMTKFESTGIEIGAINKNIINEFMVKPDSLLTVKKGSQPIFKGRYGIGAPKISEDFNTIYKPSFTKSPEAILTSPKTELKLSLERVLPSTATIAESVARNVNPSMNNIGPFGGRNAVLKGGRSATLTGSKTSRIPIQQPILEITPAKTSTIYNTHSITDTGTKRIQDSIRKQNVKTNIGLITIPRSNTKTGINEITNIASSHNFKISSDTITGQIRQPASVFIYEPEMKIITAQNTGVEPILKSMPKQTPPDFKFKPIAVSENIEIFNPPPNMPGLPNLKLKPKEEPKKSPKSSKLSRNKTRYAPAISSVLLGNYASKSQAKFLKKMKFTGLENRPVLR